MKRNSLAIAFITGSAILVFCAISNSAQTKANTRPATFRAGLRSSPYGPRNGFPAPFYWLAATRSMASRFEHAVPALVWIVGTMETVGENKTFSGRVRLSFPAPGRAHFANIVFAEQDANEAYLEQFDKNGFQVWLQVEPADADVGTLIDLVLTRYAKHPCVIGFGIDIEWHHWNWQNRTGVQITDTQAEAWSSRVRSFNSDYQLFLKHWLAAKMPPHYRQSLVFINDSQQFTSLARMLKDFKRWGKAFPASPVGFQFGYPADRNWWRQLEDPTTDIGKALLSHIPNLSDLIWVDFTMEEIWPTAASAKGERIDRMPKS